MRDSCQGPSPFGGAGGITAPPIPRNAVVDGPSVLFDVIVTCQVERLTHALNIPLRK